MVNIIDLFSGTGGFSKGFEKSEKLNSQVIAGIDLLEIACKTFQKNHSKATVIAKDLRDVRKTDFKKMINGKAVDIIIGGPPCQGFSSIRPFRSTNVDDPRNNLFEEFASYVNFFRPKYFVLENVVGLATHKNGETLKIMIDMFKNIGYDTEWRILNSANYGVPQKRERFIMLGARDGGKIKFPSPSHHFEGNTIGYKDKTKMIFSNNGDLFTDKLPKALSVLDAISDLPPIEAGQEAVKYNHSPNNNYQQERRKKTNGELSLHKATNHGEKMLEIIKYSGENISCIPDHLISSGFSTSYSRLDSNKPSTTITVNFVHPASNKCIHPNQNRALTPREGARLQSFDDNFIFCGTRTQIVKQIGNAVPPLLGKAIADQLSSTI